MVWHLDIYTMINSTYSTILELSDPFNFDSVTYPTLSTYWHKGFFLSGKSPTWIISDCPTSFLLIVTLTTWYTLQYQSDEGPRIPTLKIGAVIRNSEAIYRAQHAVECWPLASRHRYKNWDLGAKLRRARSDPLPDLLSEKISLMLELASLSLLLSSSNWSGTRRHNWAEPWGTGSKAEIQSEKFRV